MAVIAKLIDTNQNLRTLRLDLGAVTALHEVIIDKGNILIATDVYTDSEEGIFVYRGKVEFDKQASLAITAGQTVYWNLAGLFATTDAVTNGVANTRIGICVKDVAGAGTVVEAILEPNVAQTFMITRPISVTANSTVTFDGFSVGRAMNIKRISVSAQTKPIDADGTTLLNISNHDADAPADDTLLAAAFDLESLADQVSQNIPLTLVEADLQLAAGDSVFMSTVNDSAAIDTAMVDGNVTFEGETIG